MFGPFMYLRPYCGAWLVGRCLAPTRVVWDRALVLSTNEVPGGYLVRLVRDPPSHPLLVAEFRDRVVRLASARSLSRSRLRSRISSTYYYESTWVVWGKRLSHRWERAGAADSLPRAVWGRRWPPHGSPPPHSPSRRNSS